MQIKIIEPQSEKEWEAYYNLRFEILRKPWGQTKGSEKSDNEPECKHALVLDDSGQFLGCGRSEFINTTTIQIRYMAVSENARGLGLGTIILTHLETEGKNEGALYSHLHARENAIPFYEKNGYILKEKSHLLFGEIQHFLMTKKIH
jgi:GNAT superfamily N-acetyltransferase